jgi:hypothetical protein
MINMDGQHQYKQNNTRTITINQKHKLNNNILKASEKWTTKNDATSLNSLVTQFDFTSANNDRVDGYYTGKTGNE